MSGEVEENAAELKLGDEFLKAKCLMNCEVAVILEHKYEQYQQMAEDPTNQVSQVFEKSLQYVKRFSRYKNPDAVRQAREEPVVVSMCGGSWHVVWFSDARAKERQVMLLFEKRGCKMEKGELMVLVCNHGPAGGAYGGRVGPSCRRILSRYQLAEFELCVLGNLCPETVEEAIAVVPSIKTKGRELDDDTIEKMLNDLALIKKFE